MLELVHGPFFLGKEGRHARVPRTSTRAHRRHYRHGQEFFVLYKILKSFEAGRPLCYIDPKGDTYRNLLSFFGFSKHGQEIWKAYRHRILFLNPVSKSDRIVGFNSLKPFEAFDHATPDLIALLANSLVSHIRRQSGFEMAEANRMQNIMSAAIGLLVEGGKGDYSLSEIPLLFRRHMERGEKGYKEAVRNPFVNELLKNVTHHGTRSFWENQWGTWSPQSRHDWPQSTEGRIFQYLFDERLLYTTCTVRNAVLDFGRVVEEGVWLFVNIPYPLLSDTISTLLGNILVTNLFYAAMRRTPGGRDYRIILDEARFFNTGPLDTILETSRAYHLWLTLIVQSLDQMARSHDGRIDYRLKETAVNNCRYFSVFHNLLDGELFAEMMFPLTGQVVIGERQSGDFDYLPVIAEQNRYERRFQELRARQVVIYDKLGGKVPRVYFTPGVAVPQVEQGALDVFEAEHLNITGKPSVEIAREIREREEKVLSLFGQTAPRKLPPADLGGL